MSYCMPEPEALVVMPPGTYITYWARKVFVPAGELAKKLLIADIGTTGPAEFALPCTGVTWLAAMEKNIFTELSAAKLGQIRQLQAPHTVFDLVESELEAFGLIVLDLVYSY